MRRLITWLLAVTVIPLAAQYTPVGTEMVPRFQNNWRVVGAGVSASRPSTCVANRDVYICNGAGCTTNGEAHYCTATDTWTVASIGSGSFAVAAGVTTGTSTTTTITPDALAGSDYGKRTFIVSCFNRLDYVQTGDGCGWFFVPSTINTWNLVDVQAQTYTAGQTGTLNVDIARCAVVATGDQCSGAVSDMLSVNLTIDHNENKSSTAATAPTIDTSNDDVSTGQVIRVDVDGVHSGTAAQGLQVQLTFQLP